MRNLTKSKTAMSLLLIGLAAIIIGGATMAWFTGEDTIDAATFTAGTVVVNADKADPFIVQPAGKYFDNVNPGDCARVNWNIVNEGTKAVELRVKLDYEWSGVEGAEVDPFYFCPPEGSPWVLYEEDTDDDGIDETWLYYTGGPVRGTYNPDGEALEPASVPLTLVIGFDGATMENEYQGASLTLGGEGSKVEAIQASNGAPEAVWGDAFTEATGENYSFLSLRGANYFYEGLGNDMPCWGGQGPVDPEPEDEYTVTANVVVAGGGSVSGNDGAFKENDPVTLTAAEITGHQFDGWSGYEGLPNVAVDGKVLTFNMPANHVTVTANFSAVPAQKYALNLNVKHPKHNNKNWGHWGNSFKDYVDSTAVIVTGSANNEAGESITVKTTKGTYKEYVKVSKNNYQWQTKTLKFDGWYNGNTLVSSDLEYSFDMPVNPLALTARFSK